MKPEQVADFRWSSLARLVRGDRFPGLEARDWLRVMGLARLFGEEGRTDAEARAAAKSVEWKVNLAVRIRAESGAAITWIAAALRMGNPNAVRGCLSKAAKRF